MILLLFMYYGLSCKIPLIWDSIVLAFPFLFLFPFCIIGFVYNSLSLSVWGSQTKLSLFCYLILFGLINPHILSVQKIYCLTVWCEITLYNLFSNRGKVPFVLIWMFKVVFFFFLQNFNQSVYFTLIFADNCFKKRCLASWYSLLAW